MSAATPHLPPAAQKGLLAEGRRQAPYLKSVKMDSFGAFSQKTIGPFSPHLNVVFGRNEAGKTTVAAFVKGVLFGWEEARGTRNTYRPPHAERAGSLVFAAPPADDAADPDAAGSRKQRKGGEAAAAEPAREWVLSRARNADGLQGDVSLVADIDKETYTTIFSLNSDELRGFRSTSRMTAKLLTAGSGTGASPAEALAEVRSQLSELTSRSAAHPHSLTQLAAKIAQVRTELADAAEEAERYRHLDKELAELVPERAEMLQRIDEANEEAEHLAAQRALVERYDAQLADLRQQRDELQDDLDAARAERAARLQASDPDLADLTASDERALRDQIDAFAEQQAKHEHSVDLANENFASSSAAYEALLEAADQPQHARVRRQRSVQVALSVLLPVLFVGVGVPVFLHGRQIASLSFTALGVGLVVFALFLAAAALVMLFRPDKEDEQRAAQERDAHWVMLQDRKKLEACQAARQAFADHVREQLAAAGLSAAQGSLRRARSLLDEAAELRAELATLNQRYRSLTLRLSSLDEQMEQTQNSRAAAFAEAGLAASGSLADFDEVMAKATRKRNAVLEMSEGLNRRYGELVQALSQAQQAHRLDELKLRHQQLLTQQEESAQRYATLLLAQRMLQSAINAWESKSQPEVYRQASHFLSLMTDGRWEKVSLSSQGVVQVTDAAHGVCEPVNLSMGTCQQLYLALRMALLQQADNVGRAIPVFADDILVNFDAARRRGAARALAELARTRQVVLFTCHEEVVKALRKADPGLTELEL